MHCSAGCSTAWASRSTTARRSASSSAFATEGQPPHPLRRARIDTPLSTGVRAWDTLATLGRGQRVGVFAGSGVGKSTLLGMVARNTSADINVVALIGERGREVREFIESDLGPEGLARSVVIVATSDEPALVRLRAASTATRIAEWFRDRDRHVLLMMDSLTRFCMAQREIGLSAGEPPTTRAYPPSVFALLPGLLERAGTAERGSITGIYTVLVDGDDMNEPISDAARSILDGHIVLSRRLAHASHYPAIDVLSSVSRVAPAVTTPEQRASAGELRALLAAHAEARDLIEIGAYVAGTNPTVDRAVALRPRIDGFLRQGVEEKSSVARGVRAARRRRGSSGMNASPRRIDPAGPSAPGAPGPRPPRRRPPRLTRSPPARSTRPASRFAPAPADARPSRLPCRAAHRPGGHRIRSARRVEPSGRHRAGSGRRRDAHRCVVDHGSPCRRPRADG